MMEQPNLIRRPILVRGLEGDIRVRQRQAYARAAMNCIRVGTSGWSYPSGKGTWNGIFYPAARGPLAGAGQVRRAGVLRRALRHRRDQLQLLPGAHSRTTAKGWAERTPRGLRVLAQAVSEVHAPGDVPQGDRRGPVGARRRRTSTSSAPRIDPLARRGKLGALLAQFPASFKNEPDSRGYLEWLLRAISRVPVAVELRHRSWSDDPAETLQAARTRSARPGRRSTSRSSGISIRQNLLPNVKTFYYLRLHGRNAAAVVEAREVRGPLQLSVFQPRSWSRSRRPPRRRRASVKKAYLYANNHFSAKSVANAAMLKHKLGQRARRRVSGGVRRTLSRPQRAS